MVQSNSREPVPHCQTGRVNTKPARKPLRLLASDDKSADRSSSLIGLAPKRILVGPSSKNSNISSQRRYRVRIGETWYEGAFSKRWFGWNFEDFGTSGIQLNLIDEVFELPRAIPRCGPMDPPRAS